MTSSPAADASDDARLPEPRALAAALAVHLTRRTGRHVAADEIEVNASPLGTVVAVRGVPVARLWARQEPTDADAATWARAVLDQAPELHKRVETALADDAPGTASADAVLRSYRSRILAACHERFYGSFEEDVVVHELGTAGAGVVAGLTVALVRGIHGPVVEDAAPLPEDDPPVERRDDGVHVIRIDDARPLDEEGDGPVVGVRVTDGKGMVVEEALDPDADVRHLDVRRLADRVFRSVCVHWSNRDDARTVREVEDRLRLHGEAFVVPAPEDGAVDPTQYRMTLRRVSAGLDMPHVILHGRDNLALIRSHR